MFKIDRDKYIEILKAQGVNSAVTALHNDVAAWEYESFEGAKGWQPGMWSELEEIRVFSRELWDLGLSKSKTSGGTI